MTLLEMMKCNCFCVVGKTLDKEKYAYKIKHALLEKNYKVHCAPYEGNINDYVDIDIVNLCIHPIKGINILKEINVNYKGVLIQPGAESNEIIEYLTQNNTPYLKGCSLIGLKLLGKNSLTK